MAITYSSVVPHPIDQVYAWHSRRGALHRLLPPWQPLTVRAEADNVEDGAARLRLPGGITWVAQHSTTDRSHEFVDELTSLPLTWKHTHRFTREGDFATRVTDHVRTPVPRAVLRQTFRYRHRQLADDLATHEEIAAVNPKTLTIAVTGASGLIGTALSALLSTGGHQVVRLVRRDPGDETQRRWNPDNPSDDLLDGVDVVCHLAGETIAGRFTEAHKQAILDSRVEPTRQLAALAAKSGVGAFVCASAIGYYGADRGDEVLTEQSPSGDGFLAEVVREWEAATVPAAEAGLRVVNVRTGIVQSPRGGSLRMLRPLFAAGLGGRLGDGNQWTAWIDLDDICDIYLRACVDERMSGPINAVAPNPVTNKEYTATLARVMRRPAFLPVPGFGPKLILGSEGAREVAQAGQRVVPTVLTELGHKFRRPLLEDCLRHQLGHLAER